MCVIAKHTSRKLLKNIGKVVTHITPPLKGGIGKSPLQGMGDF